MPAPPERVSEVLADSPGWTKWFRRMRRVRINGRPSGVGALRTVWVGPTRVQEHFTVWEPAQRITFHVVESSSPGMRAMVEDFVISPAPGGSTLAITVGVEPKGVFRFIPGVVQFVVANLTSGARHRGG